MPDEQPSMEVTGPLGTGMRARGYDTIMLIHAVTVLVLGGIGCAVWYSNTQELMRLTDTMQRTLLSNIELAKTQRMLTCYVAIDNPKLRMEYIMDPTSVCYQVAQ